ncbi:conserved hypothetical protein [Sphingobium sp. SYK-6]|uniref:DUF885 domain-containing protein n=1 Tax=Sphingobium sp. (strain NBRC 103272 / SYK-6) TaxID=627192 RepID=UPI000227773B|nr:DUF885 family protein [Sphingobium sp. SYK-6]BAK67909.1 conserved hypothetical protein [Sphingobium sp. SYK-6]
MKRRDFLLTTAATALVSMTPRAFAQSAAPSDGLPALDATFEKIFEMMVDNSPQMATQLGLDKGPRAPMKAKLDDNSLQAVADDLALTRRALAMLDAFKDRPLGDKDALNLACVRYTLERGLVAGGKYDLSSIGRPYRIFQQGGAYFSTPDFLNSAHTIATKTDCEAYLSRLAAFATELDNDSEVQKAYAQRGYLAPAWSLDLTLGQMRTLRGQPAASCSMTRSLADRAAKAGVAGDWAAEAAKIVAEKVYPALDRQIALVEQLKPGSAAGDGVWRVPRGDEIYADALAQSTTTTMSPDEVHQMGLDQVREISAALDVILRDNGLTQGSVGARLTALNARPDQLYPDTAEGRAALLKSLNADYLKCKALLPKAFNNPSNAPLEIRAVPVEIQDGASNGYYRRAALDGSRPAIYYINLKDVADWPKYGLPALTYHEAVPGHHLQISTMQEAGALPTLRRVGGFSAYSEGWALYAEEVADELGAYATPLERAGYLQSFLFRAARLAVDTGLHAKRWTREQATQYMVDVTGFAEPRCQREVERYCTQPGQACSYKVGHAAWTRARAKAQATLGDRFDLKTFHEVLKDGAMPLTILEQRIEARTAALLKA